jgi:hypothetical protein
MNKREQLAKKHYDIITQPLRDAIRESKDSEKIEKLRARLIDMGCGFDCWYVTKEIERETK